MTSMRKALGARLAELRKRAGLSQAGAAETADISDETISRLERGAQGVSVDVLAELARAYGVELAELFSFDRNRATESEKANAIARVVALLRRQPVEQIDMVGDLLVTWSQKRTSRNTRRRDA